MKVLKKNIPFIICLFFIVGCFQKYEIYGFTSKEKNLSWGFVGAKLKGSEEKRHSTIVKSSPYNLSVWFGSEDFIEGTIQIIDIKLIDRKTKNVVFSQNDTIAKPIQKYTDSYLAYFEFGNIKIDYNEMVLQIEFKLKKDNSSIKYNTEIYFEKDYKKYRMIESH